MLLQTDCHVARLPSGCYRIRILHKIVKAPYERNQIQIWGALLMLNKTQARGRASVQAPAAWLEKLLLVCAPGMCMPTLAGVRSFCHFLVTPVHFLSQAALRCLRWATSSAPKLGSTSCTIRFSTAIALAGGAVHVALHYHLGLNLGRQNGQ